MVSRSVSRPASRPVSLAAGGGSVIYRGPSLDLDFIRGSYLARNWQSAEKTREGFSDIISFTRGSGGGRFNHLGVYEWVGNNVARIDHDPATVDTSTSSVTIGSGVKTFAVSRLYPVGQYVRATADASNWVSGRVVASTGSSVTLWVDRVVGTGTHASWTLIRVLGLLVEESRTNLLLNSATLSTQSVTVTATAHTLAFYGTGTVTLSGAATGTLVGTGANNRVTLTFTPTAGSLTLTVSGSVTSAGLQAGAFITSYIPTTTAQVTRAADQCGVSNLADWYRADEGTIVAKWATNHAANDCYIISATDGSTANTILMRQVSGRLVRTAVVTGGVAQVASNGPPSALGATVRSALVLKKDNFQYAQDGAIGWTDTSGNMPVGLSNLRIGRYTSPTIDYLSGHIESIQYIPRALSNTELQRITA